MTSTRPITWYERQKKRKSSPFFRLLYRSFGFRLLLASLISLFLLAIVHRFENCHQNAYTKECLSTHFGSIINIGNVESFSIVTAALLYILESRRRKQREHQDAWQLITTLNEAKVVQSLMRIDALEILNQDGFSLDGLNLEGANLEGLDVSFGEFKRSNLANTVLIGVNFHQTTLKGINLTNADLRQANLTEADLSYADLTGANLSHADLTGANLSHADLTGANLTSANLRQVNLTETKGIKYHDGVV